MLKLSALSFLLGSLVSYSAFSAFVFEFDNQTKSTVHVGVGTAKEPPKAADYELVAKQKFPGKDAPPLKLNPADGIQVIVKMADKKQVVYQINEKALKANKNVKLKLTTSFIGNKTKVTSQLAIGSNNISDSDIKIIAELDENGKNLVQESEKSEKSPAAKESNDKEDKKPSKPSATKPKSDTDDEEKAKTDEDETEGKKDGDDETPAEEAKPAKPKLTITPVQVLELSPTQKGDNRDAKILGMKFASTIKTATTEPDSMMPASMREDEWKKVKAAQREVTSAFEAQQLVWKKVGSSAKKILERKKVTDADEQKELAEEVLDLINLTYKQVKARFALPEGEKPAEESSDSDSSSSSDD
jgi:hypothetical protein